MAGGGTNRWLLGCGIGCGALILLGLLLAGGGYFFVRQQFGGIMEAEKSWERLVETYGEIEDYTPPADGIVPPERLELFLAVRDSLREGWGALVVALASFPTEAELEGKKDIRKVFEVIRSAGRLVAPIAGYVDRRNGLLLEAGMGPGEYTYLYCLCYHSFLGRAPDDGPVIHDDDRDQPLFDEDGTFSGPETWRRYRRFTRALLRNQLASLPQRTSDPDSAAWREELAAEIRRFGERPRTVAWEEGLPARIARVLEPHRARLEASYHPASNVFELTSEEDDWGDW
jgi:hypothetical protein